VEAAVGFVGLGDEDLPGAVQRVGAGRVQVAADRVRRLAAQRGEGDREHGGRGGLAVRPGDGDRPQPVHQRGERVGAVHDGHAQLGGAHQLGVVRADRGGDDDGAGVVREVAGGVPDVDGRAERPQRLRRLRLLGVAPGDLGTALGEDLGDPGHPGPADPDEVRTFEGGGKAGCHGGYSRGRARTGQSAQP